MNPELKKNIWLQLTPHRMVATPIVIGLVLAISMLTVDLSHSLPVLDIIFMIGIYAFACVGGTYATSNAMMSEYVDNTWDQQRMSPLSPWSLTWGKILGGASYMWFGAALCMTITFIIPFLGSGMWSFGQRLELLGLILGLACLCQPLGLILILSLGGRAVKKPKARRNYIFSIVILVVLASASLSGLVGEKASLRPLEWWGKEFEALSFVMASLWFFAGIALLGTYRLMRDQMQFQNGPLPWLFFNIFIVAYFCGFIPENQYSTTAFPVIVTVAFGIEIVIAYLCLLAQPINVTDIQRIITAFSMKKYAVLLTSLPYWATPVLLCLILALVSISLLGLYGNANIFGFVLLATFLFLLRDICIFILMALGRFANRATMATVFYLILLYAICPALFAALDLYSLMGVFYPAYNDGSAAIIPAALQCIVLGYFVVKKYRHATAHAR